MMINKRLIGTVSQSKKYIAGNVALQWCSLCANIAMMGSITFLLGRLFARTMDAAAFWAAAGAAQHRTGVAAGFGGSDGAGRPFGLHRRGRPHELPGQPDGQAGAAPPHF